MGTPTGWVFADAWVLAAIGVYQRRCSLLEDRVVHPVAVPKDVMAEALTEYREHQEGTQSP